MSLPLRTCPMCGLEAHNSIDLELFGKSKGSLYGRDNRCRECLSQYQKDYYRTHPKKRIERNKRFKDYASQHIDHLRQYKKNYQEKRISFNGVRLHFKENPRTNTCSKCGKSYPEQLSRQTSLHHTKYDPNNPLENTIEVCTACHLTLHRNEKGQNQGVA